MFNTDTILRIFISSLKIFETKVGPYKENVGN